MVENETIRSGMFSPNQNCHLQISPNRYFAASCTRQYMSKLDNTVPDVSMELAV